MWRYGQPHGWVRLARDGSCCTFRSEALCSFSQSAADEAVALTANEYGLALLLSSTFSLCFPTRTALRFGGRLVGALTSPIPDTPASTLTCQRFKTVSYLQRTTGSGGRGGRRRPALPRARREEKPSPQCPARVALPPGFPSTALAAPNRFGHAPRRHGSLAIGQWPC